MQPKLILLDGDGVIWRGGKAIPEAPPFIRRAHRAGIRCVLVSNNAGPDRDAYHERCQRLGLELSKQDIFSVNQLAGPYVARHHPSARVFVVGSEMLVNEMRKSVQATSADEWLAQHGASDRPATPNDLKLLRGLDFDAVLIGIDVNVNYLKLTAASILAQRGAVLLGANPDFAFPFEDGLFLPGNGSVVELIATVSGVKPVYIGKPELHLLEQIEAETGVERDAMVMVGDRVETDLAMAESAGIRSFLVLTGVAGAEDVPPEYKRVTVCTTLDEVANDLGIS